MQEKTITEFKNKTDVSEKLKAVRKFLEAYKKRDKDGLFKYDGMVWKKHDAFIECLHEVEK